jgi:hypothetical protein
MLICHKIIDLLRDRDRDHRLMPIPSRNGKSPAVLATPIDQAEKFDFGDISLEGASERPRHSRCRGARLPRACRDLGVDLGVTVRTDGAHALQAAEEKEGLTHCHFTRSSSPRRAGTIC